MESKIASLLLLSVLLAPVLSADEPTRPPVDQAIEIEVAEIEITGRIDGQQLAVDLAYEATTKSAHGRMLLVQGDLVLQLRHLDRVPELAVYVVPQNALLALALPHPVLFEAAHGGYHVPGGSQ